MAPNISVREYIRWLPNPAKEPTTTLVVTSAENRFVDIRILKPKNETENDKASSDVIEINRLDWAFAGTSFSEIKDTGEHSDSGPVVHSRWHHWVDSRTMDAESVVDEGDMFPQPNGTTLECGSMVNPGSGKMERYDELWRDVEAVSTEAKDGGGRVCAVLMLTDEGHKARGMVVRVGQFCQGILRVGEKVALERWVWTGEMGWRREGRIGDLFVPCGILLDREQRLDIGSEVEYGDYSWRVVEMSEF